MGHALGTLKRFLLLTGLYYAGAVLASFYLRTPEDITLFWPSAGVGFAVVVRYGVRWAVIVPAALLLLHLTLVPVPQTFLLYSIAANTISTLAAIVTAGQSGNLYALGLVSLPLALLLWSAVRFAPLTTMVGTILVVTFISLLTGLGLGGFTRPLTLLDASVLMLLLILISVIPVMLAVATYEQAHTAAATACTCAPPMA